MNQPIKLALAFLGLTASLAADIIQKPGVYRPKGGTTTLRISDSEAAVAKFEHITPDGRKTQSEVILGRSGSWFCFLDGELTLWIYQDGQSFVQSITILPPEDGKLQFRTAHGKVSIAEEQELIPEELRKFIITK